MASPGVTYVFLCANIYAPNVFLTCILVTGLTKTVRNRLIDFLVRPVVIGQGVIVLN